MKRVWILLTLLFTASCTTSAAEEADKEDPFTALLAPATEDEVVEQESPAPVLPPEPKPLPPPPQSPEPHKGSPTFAEQSCMSPAVNFWEDVYSLYSKDQMIIHHDRSFKIYKVANVPPFEQKKARSKAVRALLDEVRSSLPEFERDSVRAQSGVKERFMRGIELGRVEIPIIQERLRKEGLPIELAYIPLIESGFQQSALSKVGARGPWQIMPGTLRLYTRTHKRKLSDLSFSTDIAILILKDSYNALGDWPLAVNSYHSGIGRLRRAANDLGTKNICAIIDNFEGKGYRFASRNYYAQFLAAQRLYAQSPTISLDPREDNVQVKATPQRDDAAKITKSVREKSKGSYVKKHKATVKRDAKSKARKHKARKSKKHKNKHR